MTNAQKIKETIEILKKIEESCFETKQRNGVICYAVGGIECTSIHYKQALTLAISILSQLTEKKIEDIISPLSGLYTSDIIASALIAELLKESL